MSSSESPRDRLNRLRKRGSLSLDEYLREIELLDAEDNAAQARDETADRRSAASSANGRTGDSDEHLVDEDGMPYKPSPNRARHAAGGSGDEEDDDAFHGFDDDEPLDFEDMDGREDGSGDEGGGEQHQQQTGFCPGDVLVHESKGTVTVIRMGEALDYYNKDRVYTSEAPDLRKGAHSMRPLYALANLLLLFSRISQSHKKDGVL